MKEVKLKIDGIETTAPERTPLIKVAEKLGIHIPTLCYYKEIEPYSVCRICTVEVKMGNRSRMVTACNYPVTDGIEVFTNNEKVRQHRKILLELLLARCSEVPIIKEMAAEYGIKESRFGHGTETCILCGLCVRVCSELVKANAIGFRSKGIDREVAVPFDRESDTCIACGACAYVCPTGHARVVDKRGRVVIHSELTLGPTTAIRVPTLQAVPNAPYIDIDTCIHFKTDGCGVCQRNCEAEAIDYEMKDEEIEIEVGNVIIATGFQQFDPSVMKNYGYGKYDNVLTALEFERLNCASGPTNGQILCTNGKPPESVAILHCIGSRDERYHEYCSRVCCMYALKYAHLIKEKTNAEVYNCYIDMRCFGKGYEEFYHRLLNEEVRFIRGKAGEVTDYAIYPEEKGKLIVRVEDTLAGVIRRIPVDMVVLCAALEPTYDAQEVSRIFSCSRGKDGWFIEKHPKLGPIGTATEGVWLAGFCQGPKDIPDTVNQATGAAGEVLSLISKGEVEVESATALILEDVCTGCRICNDVCPFGAISFDEERKISVVEAALCKGCGTCAATCPSGAIKAQHFVDEQILSELEGILTGP